MEIIHSWEKAEYILIKNVCDNNELRLCKNELEIISSKLDLPEATGSAVDENSKPTKQNKGIFYNSLFLHKYGDLSPTTKIIEKVIRIIRTGNYTPHSYMNYIKRNTVRYSMLFSAYGSNDYYKPHNDTSTLTILFWLKNKDFTGGNLEFTEFGEKVNFEDNSVVAFPSHYLHAVDEVISSESGFARYVVTAFLNPCDGDKKDES